MQINRMSIVYLGVVGKQTAARSSYPVLCGHSPYTGRGTAKVRFPKGCGRLQSSTVKKLTTRQAMQGYVSAFDATDGSVVRGCGISLSKSRGRSRYAFFAPNSPWSVTTLTVSDHHHRLVKTSSKNRAKIFRGLHARY